MKKVVIIGGGPAGRLIVHALHKSTEQFDVTLIKDEETYANRCAIPYGISDKKSVDKFCISNTLVTDFGAKLVLDYVNLARYRADFCLMRIPLSLDYNQGSLKQA